MTPVTRPQLLAILPGARAKVDAMLGPLNAAMQAGEINTAARQAAFIAQVGHETAQFQFLRELASGVAYEGRTDLGNVRKGDGVRFKGRGLIQVTGRDNYAACSLALFGDLRLLDKPELLEQPEWACRSAVWFWTRHGLNALADIGNFKRITKIINGGYNGLDERVKFYQRALENLGSVHAHTLDGRTPHVA